MQANWVTHKQYGKERELHSLQAPIAVDCAIHYTIGTVRPTNDARWTWIFFQKDPFVKPVTTIQGTESTCEAARIMVERCYTARCYGCGEPAFIPSKHWDGSFLCRKCEPADERLGYLCAHHAVTGE